MSKSPKFVIFDCDGTLVDTETVSASATADVLARYGLDYSTEAVQAMFLGVHLSEILETLHERHGVSIAYSEFITLYTERMLARVPGETQVMPETAAYIRALAARGQAMAVGTNGVRSVVLAELEAAGILTYLPHIYAAEDVANPKPAPDMFLRAAADAGYAPADCLVVEDSTTGARAGLAAGMTVLGYTGYAHDRAAQAEALRKVGVINILDELAGLDSWLK